MKNKIKITILFSLLSSLLAAQSIFAQNTAFINGADAVLYKKLPK